MSKKNKLKNIFYAYLLRRHDDHDPFYKWKGKPFYAGKGKNNRKDRHLKEAIGYSKGKPSCNPVKDNIILYLIKNGIEFEIEIIKDNLTEQEAFDLEIELIGLYGRRNNGTGILANLTDGGEGSSGLVLSKERLKEATEQLLMVQELAKEWHRSEEGRKWHSEHAKNHSFGNRPLVRCTCSQCGSDFETMWPDKAFLCSNACAAAFRRESGLDNVIRTCQNPNCGKEFGTSKYLDVKCCSKECANELRKKTETQECLWCKKSFIPRGNKKFCGNDCYHEYHRQVLCKDKEYCNRIAKSVTGLKHTKETKEKMSLIQIEINKNKPKSKKLYDMKVCEYCGKDFRPKNKSQSDKQKYCSQDCFRENYKEELQKISQDKYPEHTCPQCGKIIKPKSFKEARKKFCSDECRFKNQSERQIGTKRSEESKKKMRKPRSEETKQKMRKPKTEEHKQNLKESMNKEETLQKISNSCKEAWVIRKENPPSPPIFMHTDMHMPLQLDKAVNE